ncbi:unnamed protein product [Nesidiocoris tenuis]|uniref:Uncharacterized protein n=1 Tax=Nesidiocoris tenuis TaxID=355587 RepID=A0A6H5HEW8_9HEMI|nr:unnamed protein product [Nesidiocoris tenuis]
MFKIVGMPNIRNWYQICYESKSKNEIDNDKTQTQIFNKQIGRKQNFVNNILWKTKF